MLAFTANLMAFYLAAALLERTGIVCAVAVFLVTALTGTIIASIIEEHLRLLAPKGCYARISGKAGRSAVTTRLP